LWDAKRHLTTIDGFIILSLLEEALYNWQSPWGSHRSAWTKPKERETKIW